MPGSVAANRTVFLVTHQLQFLKRPEIDQICSALALKEFFRRFYESYKLQAREANKTDDATQRKSTVHSC